MPRYFFDNEDESPQSDDEGVEFASVDAMRRQAKQTLFDMAREQVPCDGEKCSFTVVVRNETGTPVYVATLNCAGVSLTG